MPDVLSDTGAVLAGQPTPPSASPQEAQPVAPQPAQPVAPQAAVPEHVIADSLLGKGVKALARLVHGDQTQYVVDPQTGQTQEVTTKAAPGAVFKNMVLSALIGGAVGGHGFAQGFARGGAAAAGQAQQQDQLRREQAQQQFNNQIAARREAREDSNAEQDRLYHQAMIAHQNLLMVGTQQQMWRENQDHIEKHNQAARAFQQSLIDAGGERVPIPIDGKPRDTVNAGELMNAYTKDPSIARAPQGFQRHFLNLADVSELHWSGSHWVNDDGSAANMENNTEIVAIDTPSNTFKSYRNVSGAEINKIRGANIADPDKTYRIAPDALSGLYSLNMKEQAESARAAHQRELANKRGTPEQFAEVEARKQKSLQAAEKQYAKDSDVDALNRAKAEAQSAYEQEIVSLGGSVNRQPGGQAQVQPKTFSPTKWKTANPNGDVNAAIAEAKHQGLQIIQ